MREAHEAWVKQNVGRPLEPALTEVAGEHFAEGIGEVTGLDVQAPVIIKPGTRSVARGAGVVTGTRIGPSREQR
jgi:hypothetical protein